MSGDTFSVSPPRRGEARDRAEWGLMYAIRSLHGINASTEYEMALSLLNDDMGAALLAAQRAADSADHDPMLRWSIATVLGATRNLDAASFLHGYAVRELGERHPKGGCEQPIDAEALVAVAAVEGLMALLSSGPEQVTELLFDVIARQQHRPVREAAARGLVIERPEVFGVVAESLGEDRYWLDLRAAVVEDLTLAADPENPDRGKERRLAGQKPASCDHATRRQRPVANTCSGSETRDIEHG